MTMTLLTANTYEVVQCYRCGVSFGMPADFYQLRRRDRETWYCINGHAQHFTGPDPRDTRVQALEEQLAASRSIARAERERRETTERSRAAIKGVATRRGKQLARVANGVCPCCRRSFAQLQRHMSSQHPGFHPAGEQ